MPRLPENEVTVSDLMEWDRLRVQLTSVRNAEMLLRKKIFNHYFPAPKEGTNTAPLANGYVLKGNFPITRDVDTALLKVLLEQFNEAHISADSLIEYKAALVLRAYRTLTAEQQHLFDQCLIIKPGSPALDIVLPAKAAKAQG